MKKKMYLIKILIIITFLILCANQVFAADRTLIEMYITWFYGKDANEALEFLENCSDTELEKVATHEVYYDSEQGNKEIEQAIIDYQYKYDAERLKQDMSNAISNYVQSAQDIISRRKLGAEVGKTDAEKPPK